MDQIKVGRFITSCRKEAGFTQAALAEKLNLTDKAVSKWENGKSLPDASIMLDLCDLLNISVNELLLGERIIMEDYKKVAEANLLELTRQIEKYHRNWLRLETVMVSVSIPILVLLCIAGAYECNMGNTVAGGLLIVLSLVFAILFYLFGLKIEHDAGYYECPNCGERYVPTMKAVFLAPHIGHSRKMVCPCCGKRGYHKKVISKTKE